VLHFIFESASKFPEFKDPDVEEANDIGRSKGLGELES
jgi:hypothetical protein